MDKFNSLCRLCMSQLRPDNASVDLFENEELFLWINETIPKILIVKNDVLPHHICQDCFEELQKFTKFKRKCEKSNTKLLEMYEKIKSKMQLGLEIEENVENTSNSKKILKEFICLNCNERLSDEVQLQTHIDTHRCHVPLNCQLCNMTFSSKKALRRHYLSSSHYSKIKDIKIEGQGTTIQRRLLSCERCSKSFSRIDLLRNHIRTHTDNVSKKYECDICSKVYNLKSVLKEHILKHTGSSKALCSFCGKSFNSKANLKQHLLRHTQTKSFQCTICPKSFVSKGELQSHSRTHSGAKPFVCDTCGSAFTMSYSLRKHKRTHTGERPYICSYCQKGFKILETLKIHTRIHTGEKPYVCSFCKKAFAQKNDMIKHERIHRDERLYGCAFCQKRFIQASTLNAHVKGVHKGQTIILATQEIS